MAWLQNATMHEAVDILSGGRQYSQLPAPPATQKTKRTDEDNAYNATWRSKVAGEAQRNHYRLLEETAGAGPAHAATCVRLEDWRRTPGRRSLSAIRRRRTSPARSGLRLLSRGHYARRTVASAA